MREDFQIFVAAAATVPTNPTRVSQTVDQAFTAAICMVGKLNLPKTCLHHELSMVCATLACEPSRELGTVSDCTQGKSKQIDAWSCVLDLQPATRYLAGDQRFLAESRWYACPRAKKVFFLPHVQCLGDDVPPYRFIAV